MSKNKQLNILMIEDDEDHIELIRDSLEKAFDGLTITTLTDGRKAVDHILSLDEMPDVILLDYHIPSVNGIEILRLIKEKQLDLAVIVLTGDTSIQTAVDSMREGALDFMPKTEGFYDSLPTMINKVIKIHKVNLEKKQIEEELRESEEKYHQLFSTETDAIILFDAETLQIVDINKSSEFLYGYGREEFLNLKITDVSAEVEDTEDSIKKTLEGKLNRIPIRYHKKKDGTVFPVEISASTFELKGRQVLYGVMRDITERTRIINMLQESEERFRGIIENSVAGYFFIDNDGFYQRVNDAWLRMHGYSSPDEVIGKHFSLTHADSDYEEVQKYFTKSLKGDSIELDEICRKCKDESVGYHIISARQVIKGDKIIGIESFIIDITERKQAEILQQSLQKVREKIWAMRTPDDIKEVAFAIREGIATLNVDFHGFGMNIINPSDDPLVVTVYEVAQNSVWVCEIGTAGEQIILDIWRKGLTDYRKNLGKEDVNKERGLLAKNFKCQIMSVIDVPFSHGTLAVNSEKPDAFSEHDIELLEEMAQVLSEGFKRTEDLIRLEKYAKELEIDITERKKAEEALIESEEKYRNSFDNSRDAIKIFSKDGKFIDVNKKLIQLSGYSKKELLSMKMEELYPEVVKLATKERIKKMLQGEILPVFETYLITKKGKNIPVEIGVAALKDCYGQKIVFQSNIRDITERKITEESLRLERIKLVSVFESMEDGVYIVNKDHDIEYVNPVLKKDFGPYKSQKCYEYFHDREEVCPWCKNDEVFAGETVRWEKYIFKNQRTYDLIDTPLKNPDGSISKLEILRDITEQKKAENELVKKEKYFRSLINGMKEDILVINADYRIIDINNSVLVTSGKKREEIIGRSCFEVSHGYNVPCDKHGEECLLSEVFETGEPRNHHHLHTHIDGTRVWVDTLLSPVKDENGNVIYVVESVRDVSDLMQSQEALRESEVTLKSIIKSAPIGIGLVCNRIIKQVNDRFCEMVGYSSEELLEKDARIVYPSDEDYEYVGKEKYAQIKKVGTGTVETRFKRKDGKIINVVLSSTALNPDDLSQGVIFTALDITERKQLEEERAKASKLESIGILAGGIAHDFNNILAAILGNISLAKMDIDSKSEEFEVLTEAENASLQAKGLTQQLLTFSRGGAPVKETINLTELIRDTARFSLRGSNVGYRSSITPDLWNTDVDRGQINQALSNLIINAQHAMPEGGTINIKAENITVTTEDNIPLREGRYIKISIIDKGIGIPIEHLSTIFDPYFTTKQKGSGLGLATSYSIIKKHDGHIAVESEVGVGTTFYIYLPVSSKQVEKKEAVKKEFAVMTGKILFMDDEPSVRNVVNKMLTRVGSEVEVASDGAEAIKLYKKAMDSNKPFDVVIMDLTIPGGMGGKETVKKLLKIDSDTKAIVSSGYSTDSVIANFKEYGFRDKILKPYKLKNLIEVLNKVMKA